MITAAIMAAQISTKRPAIRAAMAPRIGPKIGIILTTPTMQPKAPGFGTFIIQSTIPEANPIIKHCKKVPLIKPAITWLKDKYQTCASSLYLSLTNLPASRPMLGSSTKIQNATTSAIPIDINILPKKLPAVIKVTAPALAKSPPTLPKLFTASLIHFCTASFCNIWLYCKYNCLTCSESKAMYFGTFSKMSRI